MIFFITIQIGWKIRFALIRIVIKWSLPHFAHDTTAVLLWHVKKLVVICWSLIELQQYEFSILFDQHFAGNIYICIFLERTFVYFDFILIWFIISLEIVTKSLYHMQYPIEYAHCFVLLFNGGLVMYQFVVDLCNSFPHFHPSWHSGWLYDAPVPTI